MPHKRLAIIVLIVIGAVALIIAFAPVLAEVQVGSKAPDFSLATIEGKAISLKELNDKPTILVFWATWCPHCRTELPIVEKIYKDLHPKGANFIGVSLDDSTATAKKFVQSNHISFPIAVAGSKSNLLGSYSITGIPMVFVIDKGSIVKARYAGKVTESTIRGELLKLGVK